MAVPRKPSILLFAPFPGEAVVNLSKYIDDPAHTDTGIKIWNVSTGALIEDYESAAGTRNNRITGLALAEGTLYRARARFKNADGWGAWSPNAISKVPVDLSHAPITVPGEPASGGTSPFAPEFVYEPEFHRAMREWQAQTAHVIRRPRNLAERRVVQLVWALLSQADRDTQRDFLRARIDAAESFTLVDHVATSKTYFPRRGTLEHSLAEPSKFIIKITADETKGGA